MNPAEQKKIADLIFKHNSGQLTALENVELQAWVNQSEQNSSAFKRLTDTEELAEAMDEFSYGEKRTEAMWLKMLERGLPRQLPVRMFPWKKVIGIAAAGLLFVAGAWFWNQNRHKDVTITKN